MILIFLLSAIFCLPNFESQACCFLSTPKPRSWADGFPKGSFILMDESVVLYLVDYQPELWLGSRQVLALLHLIIFLSCFFVAEVDRQQINNKLVKHIYWIHLPQDFL